MLLFGFYVLYQAFKHLFSILLCIVVTVRSLFSTSFTTIQRQKCETRENLLNFLCQLSAFDYSVWNMNVWWSLSLSLFLFCVRTVQLKAKHQIYSFANSYTRVGASLVHLFLLVFLSFGCCVYVCSERGIIIGVQVHKICRLLSIVCHGKRQLLLSVVNRIAFFTMTKGNKKKWTLTTATTKTPSYKHITKQMVYIVCRYNVYRICQPTNSLFQKPYNEINSDKIYVGNATENQWQ